MYLDKEVDALYQRLVRDGRLKDYKIIKAYPYAVKPTRLDKQVIALSPSSIDAKSVSLGDESLYGRYCIDIDVFSPFDMGSPAMSTALEDVLVSATDNTVVGISVSAVTKESQTKTFRARCTLTYCYVFKQEEA